MTNTDPRKIRNLARILYGVTWLAMIGLPVTIIAYLLTGEITPDALRAEYPHISLPENISSQTFFIALMIRAIPIAVGLIILWHMQKLFALYMQGETLTLNCTHRILRIGQGLVCLGIASIVTTTAVIAYLSLGNPPGQRYLSISLGDAELRSLMAGGLLVIIGWISKEAARAEEENKAFV